MLKAIYYKEWLKVRWAYAALFAITFLVTLYIYLDISNLIKFNAEKAVWYRVIFMNFIFYSTIKYLPLLSGITLALTQFIPEVISARLKLTFHLPIEENKALIHKVFFGAILLLVLFLFMMVLLLITTAIYFPFEVLCSLVITILPLIFSGFIGYFTTAYIIVEPKWLKRFFSITISYGLIQLFLKIDYPYPYNLYEKHILIFALICFTTLLLILYSGYRFRRGVQ